MDVVDHKQASQYELSNPGVRIPQFPTLSGEHPLLVSKTADGNATVTNFRFCACERRSFINIPLMMVGELVVIEAAKRLRIGCKDGSTYSCTFATIEDLTACTALLKEKTGPPQSKEALFAYRFYEAVMCKLNSETILTKRELEHVQLCQEVNPEFAYSFGKEVQRLGFDTSRRRIWRMSHANEEFEFCPSYPKIHILPTTVDDDKLKISLDFRAMKRFPSVVWRDKRTGMVLIRSSQPLSSFLGMSYFTNHVDVFLIEEIVKACNKDWSAIVKEEQKKAGRALPELEINSTLGQENGQRDNSNTHSLKEDGAQGSLSYDDSGGANGHGASNGNYYYDDGDTPKKLAIVDCRSLAGVWGNSFKGGGTEDEVLYKCNIVHLDLANIHTVRDSFNKLRALCHAYVEGTFYKNLTGCMWLTYISALLRGANIVVELMHVMRRPVLVHCSDGWDRTSQIVSLSELMLDPYYRTLEGFQVLVEREWLHFGHKFGERGGHDPNCSDTSQISPIFLQFLDCVYQLTHQYPAEFQFNEAYLVKLLQSSQSCLYGTFLHNCQRERENCLKQTATVWSLLNPERTQFVNLLYRPSDKVLTAKISEHDIVLWKSVYMAGLSPMPHVSHIDFYHESTQAGGGEEVDGIPRSKSFDDLPKISADSERCRLGLSASQTHQVASASPGTNRIHDDSPSAELLQIPEDSPHLTVRSNLSVNSEESSKDSQRRISSDTLTSIKQSSSGSESSSLHCDTLVKKSATDVAHEDCATISLQEDFQLSPDKIYVNGQNCDAKLSDLSKSTNELGDVYLPEDSRAESLNAFSSVVFCQENGFHARHNEKTLCCDSQVISTDSQVLSEKTKLSIVCNGASGCDARQVRSCSKIYSKSVENIAAMTNSSLKVTSSNGLSTCGYNLKQTSLLTERLALSGDLEVTQNGRFQNISYTRTNGRIDHLNDEDSQHSMKSGNISDPCATLTAQAQRAVPRKLLQDSGHLDGLCNGGDMVYTQIIRADTVEINCLNSETSLSKSVDFQETYGIDYSRGTTNSVSTDTLMGDSEPGEDDLVTHSVQVYSKPLEVSTHHHEKFTATVPHTSSLKRNSYSSDVNEVSGSNLISRRANAASGASQNLGVSPCMCHSHWPITGHLRYPNRSEIVSRRQLGATVATSTTDISDSHVGQQTLRATDRQPSIAQHIDIDGLTLFCDERQDLLAELVKEKDREIQYLKCRLDQATQTSSQMQQPQAELDNAVTDSDGGELGSLGAVSNASDTSWEKVGEDEPKLVLWVPDAAVTHCGGCDKKFWVCIRKHHCRNCGNVFCADCSSFQAHVPHMYLTSLERVCQRCYSQLKQLSPGASSDGRILTVVADG